MLNITNIPAPRVPLMDERTGLMSREWYRFFFNLFVLTGSGGSQTTLDDLQVSPALADFNNFLVSIGDLQQVPPNEGQYAPLVQMIQDAVLSIPTAYVTPSAYASSNGLTMASGRILGRSSAGFGPAEEIAVVGTSNGGTNLSSFNANGVMYASSTSALATSGSVCIDSSQNFYVGLPVTTASAANAYIDTTTTPAGQIKRSTSSIRYKTSVETLSATYANAILTARPVWYRSSSAADNADHSWYGFIAEELAEIDPRLVHWGYDDADYDVVATHDPTLTENDAFGASRYERKLKVDAIKKPDGVQYERVSVLLLDVVRRMKEDMDTMKAEIAALKAPVL